MNPNKRKPPPKKKAPQTAGSKADYVDHTSDDSWVGRLKKDGHTIVLGPTPFVKSKPSRKRGGKLKSDERFVVLACKGQNASLVYHDGDVGRPLDMSKCALPLDSDTWLNSDDFAGHFTVEVSARSGSDKAGVHVQFASKAGPGAKSEINTWTSAIRDAMASK